MGGRAEGRFSVCSWAWDSDGEACGSGRVRGFASGSFAAASSSRPRLVCEPDGGRPAHPGEPQVDASGGCSKGQHTPSQGPPEPRHAHRDKNAWPNSVATTREHSFGTEDAAE